jgi:phosphorylcholine metabolism protein LicD
MQQESFNSDTLPIAYNTLEKVVDILKEHDIPYYLDCGTLLGSIRENKLLEHDTDVDVSIHLSLWDKLTKIDFEKYGFVKWRQSEPDNEYKLISVNFSDQKIYCDIYANPCFPKLQTRVMKNKQYYVPVNSGLYLTQLYGDWKKPSTKHAAWPEFFYTDLIKSDYAKYWDRNYKIIKN